MIKSSSNQIVHFLLIKKIKRNSKFISKVYTVMNYAKIDQVYLANVSRGSLVNMFDKD